MSEPMQRRLAAIVSADVVGYSRLMGADEAGTLAALRAHRAELIDGKIAEHGSRSVKTMGDGMLLEFPSVVNVVNFAVTVQTAMEPRNQNVPSDRRIEFRIGINLGDIAIDGDDIFGDGVNVAARLQETSVTGGMVISGIAHESLGSLIDIPFEDGGEQQFKNIARAIRVWRWAPEMIACPHAVTEPLTLPDKPSIAVLPLDNMSGDPEQEFFADGIAEDVITALSRFRSLFVTARNSSFTYKGQAVDITKVARELGVRYVVEGSVRKAGNQVRITAQLIDGATSNHLWADRYDGSLDDVFELQDQVTESIVGEVEPEIGAHERDLARRKPPENLDAWELVQQGLVFAIKPSRDNTAKAKELFGKAIAKYPDFAMAHAHLAEAYWVSSQFGHVADTASADALAKSTAKRAIELDPNDPLAHFVLGQQNIYSGDVDAAISEMQAAVGINPNFATAYYGLDIAHLFAAGDAGKSISYFDIALRLSPRDPMRHLTLMNKGSALRHLGRHDEAIKNLLPSLSGAWICIFMPSTTRRCLGGGRSACRGQGRRGKGPRR